MACAGNFPGGPVVKTLHFHCQGPGFGVFQVRELRTHMQKKKKKKSHFGYYFVLKTQTWKIESRNIKSNLGRLFIMLFW